MSDSEGKRSDRETSELESLLQEIAELREAKVAFDAQNSLLKASMMAIQTARGSLMQKTVLQQALSISSQVVQAEESSLFLIDGQGVVMESILARGATIREQKQNIIGKVLDKGLAGWVIKNRRIGLIKDTTNDERWLTLPNQPYTVRSVLCVPILKGRSLLGIITLMHPQPEHFNRKSVELMQMMAQQMVMVLDNVRLCLELERYSSPPSHLPPRIAPEKKNIKADSLENNLDKLGIYIIAKKGKFLYANKQLARIFGYSFGELVALESLFTLVSTSNLEEITKKINRCFQGQDKKIAFTFQGRGKDASIIDVQIYGHRTKFYGKTAMIGVLKQA